MRAMIVDVHTHAPRFQTQAEALRARPATDRAPMRPDRPDPEGVTWDDYLQAMQFVDRAVVFNIAAAPPGHEHPVLGPLPPSRSWVTASGAREVNDNTAALVRAHPDKLIGFLGVHPSDPQALDEVERAVRDLGLRGIKLGPNYQNFDPVGEDAFRLYARAQELGLPILFHQGTSPVRYADLDYAHPRHMDRVATKFPELRIVLAHVNDILEGTRLPRVPLDELQKIVERDALAVLGLA